MDALALILAAGKGTRMRSALPKPIVSFKGKPLVTHIIKAFKDAGVSEVFLVVGHGGQEVIDAVGKQELYISQEEQKGTAHAVLQGKDILAYKGKNLFVFVGDSPLISSSTIQQLKNHHERTGAACTFLTADFPSGIPYARVIRDEKGTLIKCIEEKNATEKEKSVTELLSSHFIFNADLLFDNIHRIEKDRHNGEYYLTDMITLFLKDGLKVETLKIKSYPELMGLNTPEELAWAENISNKTNE
jgi:bifunctional N-acetylglucosamine-1-phosphate-uridyltransferase/glucosamine-1-phosphate-acetyltransferase GlmU-like protein